mgnify:CR=1 FL=1
MREEDVRGLVRMMPNAAVLTAYGMTEACSSMSYRRVDGVGVDAVATDGDDDTEVYVGEVPAGIFMGVYSHGGVRRSGRGELVTRGRHVFAGYLQGRGQYQYQRRSGEEDFVLDFRDGSVYFRTGDIGRVEGDRLWLSGRIKDMIKTGGENVHGGEVERVLGGAPGVVECSVFGVPDVRWGEAVGAAVVVGSRFGSSGEENVVRATSASASTPDAVLVTRDDDSRGVYAGLKAHCRERGLASFKVPKVVLVMNQSRRALPKTATGKVVKRLLVDEVVVRLNIQHRSKL